MGRSFGLSWVKDGGDGRSAGRLPIARWIALWTSVAAAEAVAACYHFDARYLHKLLLERRGDVSRHNARVGARIAHRHLDYWIVNARQVVYRHLHVAENPEEHCRERQQYGHHRPVYKYVGNRPLPFKALRVVLFRRGRRVFQIGRHFICF